MNLEPSDPNTCHSCRVEAAAWRVFVAACSAYLAQPTTPHAERVHEACLLYVQTARPRET
ncbi:MAG: hypothetical protein WCF04_09050 [Candidatus Nanopelagicales bacterium]